MPFVFEPWSLLIHPWISEMIKKYVGTYGSRNVVGSTLSAHANKHFQGRQLKFLGWIEGAGKGFQDFQSLWIFLNDNLYIWLRFRSRSGVIRKVSGSKSINREVLASRCREFKQFTRRQSNGISHRVERQLSRECHGSDNGRGCKEVHSFAVPVVPGFEVTIEASQNSWRLSLTRN